MIKLKIAATADWESSLLRPNSLKTSPKLVVMWPVLMSWGWLRDEMKYCGWLSGDVKWGNVVSCKMSRHFTWCNAISGDVLSCDELSFVVKWGDAMAWDLMSLWCDVAGCEVMLCGSKWLRDQYQSASQRVTNQNWGQRNAGQTADRKEDSLPDIVVNNSKGRTC